MYDESIKQSVEGLRAMEASYFKKHYNADFAPKPASESQELIDYVANILKTERDIVIAAEPVEASQLFVDNIKWTHVFYANGLGINVLYQLDGEKPKRAVGFKLSEGMEVPAELAEKFKFATMKSKLAGTVRGSFFVIKGDY